MKYLLLILPLCVLACKNTRNPSAKSFEVKNRVDANFTLEAHAIYPEEVIKLSVNHTLVYQSNPDSQHTTRDEHIFFDFPDTIKTVQIQSEYKGRTIIYKIIEDTLMLRRIALFISPPYPKSLGEPPLSPAWKPNWKNVSIDSAQRIIKLVPDTAVYWSCGLQHNS